MTQPEAPSHDGTLRLPVPVHWQAEYAVTPSDMDRTGNLQAGGGDTGRIGHSPMGQLEDHWQRGSPDAHRRARLRVNLNLRSKFKWLFDHIRRGPWMHRGRISVDLVLVTTATVCLVAAMAAQKWCHVSAFVTDARSPFNEQWVRDTTVNLAANENEVDGADVCSGTLCHFADGVPYLETSATFGMFVAAISTLGVEMLELLGRVFAREPLCCDSRPTRTDYSYNYSCFERTFLPLGFRITVAAFLAVGFGLAQANLNVVRRETAADWAVSVGTSYQLATVSLVCVMVSFSWALLSAVIPSTVLAPHCCAHLDPDNRSQVEEV